LAKIRKIGAPKPLAAGAISDRRQLGLRAFQNSRFDEAIRLWSPLAERDEQVRAALAEAYFRRAIKQGEEKLADLRQAATLAPNDARYQYHLGMQLHQTGELTAAIACYRAVIERGGPHGAALLLAVALLEQRPDSDLASLPGSTPELCAVLAPAQSLLQDRQPPDTTDGGFIVQLRRALGLGQAAAEAVAQLWRGLGQIAAHDGEAAATLGDPRSLPNPQMTAIRRSYSGVAAASAGEMDTAFALWQKVYDSGTVTAALLDNLTAALYDRLTALLDADDQAGATDLALQTVALPLSNAAVNELRVQQLDRSGHAAAVAGDWARAITLWTGARQIVAANQGLGSPRPLWHNLALAYEAQERWIDAADAWRGLLRTRPRRRGGEQDDTFTDAQWAWVRKRVIECYKHAGRPDEAVTVFRQMIKAEPNDLDLRLQLADALLGNGQEQAAHNEVQRILKVDPHFADAQARNAMLLAARGNRPAAEQALRDAVAHHPERTDLRSQLTRMLLDHAVYYVGYRLDSMAEPLLREGQKLEPANEQFPLNLARVCFNQKRPDEARSLLEQVMELSGDRPNPYIDVFQCWVIEENLDAAREVISRAEATFTPLPEFYAQLGILTITETTLPPPMLNPFLPMAAPPKPPPPVDTAWTALGRELLERAAARQPDDVRLHGMIAAGLMGPRPDIAQPYADAAARLAPDEPNTLILRAVILAMNEHKREAKDQLRKAANLARKQGDRELAAQADAMRREVDSPLFRAAFQMQSLVDDLDDDFDDLF
jgi:pentatricopeptide repeat protein